MSPPVQTMIPELHKSRSQFVLPFTMVSSVGTSESFSSQHCHA